MAGQRTGQNSGITLIGVDPGERWTGIASIEVLGRYSIWRSGVVQSHGDYLLPVYTLEWLFRSLRTPIAALEDFHVRPVGHQSFTKGETLKLIGAMEYSARTNDVPLYLYPPGNIDRDLGGFGLDKVLEMWKWPKSSSHWEHARSAWRILGFLLLNHKPSLHYLFDINRIETSEFAPFIPFPWPVEEWSGTWTTPVIMQRKR